VTIIKVHACHVNSKQARIQTMNTVGAADSSAGVYMYTCLYTYVLFYYTCSVCVMCVYIYIYIYIYKNITKHLACSTYIFENWLFPTAAVQQRQHADVVGRGMFFIGPIRTFVFNILRTPSRCIRICSGCIAPP